MEWSENFEVILYFGNDLLKIFELEKDHFSYEMYELDLDLTFCHLAHLWYGCFRKLVSFRFLKILVRTKFSFRHIIFKIFLTLKYFLTQINLNLQNITILSARRKQSNRHLKRIFCQRIRPIFTKQVLTLYLSIYATATLGIIKHSYSTCANTTFKKLSAAYSVTVS